MKILTAESCRFFYVHRPASLTNKPWFTARSIILSLITSETPALPPATLLPLSATSLSLPGTMITLQYKIFLSKQTNSCFRGSETLCPVYKCAKCALPHKKKKDVSASTRLQVHHLIPKGVVDLWVHMPSQHTTWEYARANSKDVLLTDSACRSPTLLMETRKIAVGFSTDWGRSAIRHAVCICVFGKHHILYIFILCLI